MSLSHNVNEFLFPSTRKQGEDKELFHEQAVGGTIFFRQKKKEVIKA